MKYHISIHISPYEIDNYQLFIHQLRRNLGYINDKEIIFNPCLNLSKYFYDWESSILKNDFFINKFNELNKIVQDKVVLDPIINYESNILGALSYKRYFLEKYKNEVDAFIWFDSDMIFPDDLLFYLVNSFESINQKYCIITPQITKLWDNTWDVIVNENYINQVPSNYIYTNFDGYSLYDIQFGEKKLIENYFYTKFASGWGNLLSSDLFKKYVEFTEDLGHYGIDDTFIMYVLDLYREKEHNIKQFILQNLVVIENNKFKISSYDNLITKNQNTKSKEEFRAESEYGMINQLKKIKNSLI
jgi:hypothetical protein